VSGRFSESVVEDAALAWLEALGYTVLHGPDIEAGETGAERSDPNYRDVVLDGRLRQALDRLNPDLPSEALEDAYRKLKRSDALSLVERNRILHRATVDGITVEYRRRSSTSTHRTTTIGWLSTSSPCQTDSTRADRTWCCSSTDCP
jgi:type I restriction enzyme, R subunit